MPYSREDVRALYDQPLLPLLDEARRVHTANHPDNEVQLCTLLSVKTGGCPEDCAYCTQSSHYETSGSGGIIGMGESPDDRCEMLRTLANLTPQPESVPINALVPMAGTPLANAKPVDPLDLVRMIAVARILMPMSRVRLSAGRQTLSREAQMLCMLAGANSIFYGEKLLTAPNPEENEDLALLRDAGLQPMPPRTTADA